MWKCEKEITCIHVHEKSGIRVQSLWEEIKREQKVKTGTSKILTLTGWRGGRYSRPFCFFGCVQSCSCVVNCSEFTTHCPWSLVLNLVPGMTKRDCTCTTRAVLTYADVWWHMMASLMTYDVVSWRLLTYVVHADVCWPMMLTYADVCWLLLTYADVCWRLLKYDDVWWRQLTYDVDVYWRVLTYWRMLTYVDVYGRLLTYPDVWSPNQVIYYEEIKWHKARDE